MNKHKILNKIYKFKYCRNILFRLYLIIFPLEKTFSTGYKTWLCPNYDARNRMKNDIDEYVSIRYLKGKRINLKD